MQTSKMQAFLTLQSMLSLDDQLHHIYCKCQHCTQNTRPIMKPIAPRDTSEKEKSLANTKAYEFMLKQMTKEYSGKCCVPDVFVIADACMIFQSRSQGKPRIREHQSNIEARKHFEEQKKKSVGAASQLMFSSILTIVDEAGPNQTSSNKSQRQIAIMAYHDGTEQLLTELLLSKILDKRKNDPSWEGVSHIQLIPPEVKHPIKKLYYNYIRSEDTLPLLTPLIQRLAFQMDNIEQTIQMFGYSARNELNLGFLKLDLEQQMQSSTPNPQTKPTFPFSAHKNTCSLLLPSLSHQEITTGSIAAISLELISYIEVSSFTRVLQVDFDFFSDGSKVYLSGVRNFISERLEGGQLTLVHDRYQPLEEISLRDIAATRETYVELEKDELWKICAAVVKECLEFRKVELKLESYKNPSQDTLLKIFMKIFPQFKTDGVFENVNWKNELEAFITSSRNKINKVIRADEGIRILRRFSIEFRRTFH